MKAVVVGSGGWGTALALVLCDNGHDVTLWSHNPEKAAQMTVTRENPLLKGVHIPEQMKITGDLSCLEGADMVVTASPSFAVRETGRKIAPYLREDSIVVTVSKGIERDTNLRMSQVLREETNNICKVVALSGPSHAEEVGLRLPTGCVSACSDRDAARFVQDAFMNDYFRVYTSYDIIGVELAAALKNVVALSCGICAGLGFQDNTKALLMTRAMAEMGRLGEKLGVFIVLYNKNYCHTVIPPLGKCKQNVTDYDYINTIVTKKQQGIYFTITLGLRVCYFFKLLWPRTRQTMPFYISLLLCPAP